MKIKRYKVALLLLMVAAVESSVATTAVLHAGVAPAGCHQHGKSPAPQQEDHACCVAGHGFAVVRPSLVPRPLAEEISNEVAAPRLQAAVVHLEGRIARASLGFASGSMPLRV